MKLGIMQPYFFPYIGYYSLINHTDRWIVFDTVQFIRHGWIERNRVLKPVDGWQYISVPLQKHSRDAFIKDISIRNEEDWREKVIRQLEHYKKKAPFYTDVQNLIKESLNTETESIVKLNTHILSVTCNYIGIPFKADIFSEVNSSIEPVTHAGEWALNISKTLQATEYVNPPGGMDIFKEAQFKEAGIKLSFLKNKITEYDQKRKVFEPGLSIIDVLMFNDAETTKALISNVEVLTLEKKDVEKID